MVLTFSSKILTRYVAPGLPDFTDANIPDLREQFPEAPHWVQNHFLSSVFRGSFTGNYRQLVDGVVRRAYHAFDRYHRARDATLGYLASAKPNSPSISRYFAAVEEWEIFAHHVSIAIDLVNELNEGAGGARVYEPGDGSKEQRLHLIGNQIKHLDSCTRTKGLMTDDDKTPLWLTNAGPASFGVVVGYQEVADVLSDLSRVAEQLQDPKGFSEHTP